MIPILMYHRVNNTPPDRDIFYGMSIAPHKFEKQIRFLAENDFRSLTMSEVLQYHLSGNEPRGRCVAITFDDGYEDNFDTAWPILKKYGFTATIFLVADRIGKSNDWDRHNDDVSARIMKLSCIRDMKNGGVEFGSHTLTHVPLTRVSEDEARRQIYDSRQVLMNYLGTYVDVFSYPYDLVNQSIAHLVEGSGYKGACGTSILPHSVYNLWRMEVLGHDTMGLFRLKALGYYYLFMWLRDQTLPGRAYRKLKQTTRGYIKGIRRL